MYGLLRSPRCPSRAWYGLVAHARKPWGAAALAIVLITTLVVSGCTNDQENARPALSVTDCLAAWNAGTLQPAGSPAQATHSYGLIGRNVLLVPGFGSCDVSFQLAGGEVQTFRGGATNVTASEIRDGVGFHQLGRFAQSRAAFASLRDVAVTPGSGWNGCQADSGSLHAAGHCPPHDPDVRPYPLLKQDIAYIRSLVRRTPRTPKWWLGLRFQGSLPFGVGTVKAGTPSALTDIRYSASADGRLWSADIITIPRMLSSVPCGPSAPRLFSSFCSRNPQSRRLNPYYRQAAVIHPTQGVTVFVLSSYSGYAASPNRPMPQGLIKLLRAHLQPAG